MICWFLLYLLIHFLAYVLVLRYLARFQRERAILLYHVAPAAIVAGGAFGVCLFAPGFDSICLAIAMLSLQGIYSLSFLELWSLTQGGYSLNILARFCSAAGTASPAALAALRHLGAGKRSDRLASLHRLHLIRAEGSRFRLTRRGRTVAALLRCIARAVNLKQLG